jgi:hypothetical protein
LSVLERGTFWPISVLRNDRNNDKQKMEKSMRDLIDCTAETGPVQVLCSGGLSNTGPSDFQQVLPSPNLVYVLMT